MLAEKYIWEIYSFFIHFSHENENNVIKIFESHAHPRVVFKNYFYLLLTRCLFDYFAFCK